MKSKNFLIIKPLENHKYVVFETSWTY